MSTKTVILREVIMKKARCANNSWSASIYGRAYWERVYDTSKIEEEVIIEKDGANIFLSIGDNLYLEELNSSFKVKDIKKSLCGTTYILIDNPRYVEDEEDTSAINDEVARLNREEKEYEIQKQLTSDNTAPESFAESQRKNFWKNTKEKVENIFGNGRF